MGDGNKPRNRDLAELLDQSSFAEGHELLDMMQHAASDPNVELTEVEKCRLYLGSLLFAATIEGLNKAQEKFAVDLVELADSSWVMTGEAVACAIAQAFHLQTPRARKTLRNTAKARIMDGYDAAMEAIEKFNRENSIHG